MYRRKSKNRKFHGHDKNRSAGQLQKTRARSPQAYELESLERRMLLSVNALTLAGPFFTTGAVFVYTETSDQVAGSATITQSVIGPATAPTGEAAIERQVVTETTSDTGQTSSETGEDFYAITPQGVIEYGKEDTSANGDVDETSYSPPQQTALTTLTGGVEVTSSTEETDNSDVGGSDSTSTSTVTDTYELVSETPQMITVPAGTFSAYEVINSETNTMADGTTSTSAPVDEYWSPQAGLIELVTDEGGQVGVLTAALTSYTVPADHLVFTTQPPTGAQPNVAIPVTVTVEDGNNAVDTTASGTIDLTLNTVENGVGAVLGGTVSANIVNGVATFTTSAGPTIDVTGTYSLTATDNGANVTTADATSSQFSVGNTLTWTGAGDGSSWSDAKNWDLDAAPVSGDSLIFAAGSPLSPNNNIAGLTINTIDIQGGGYTLAGNAISLTGGLTSEAGNNTYNIATTLVGSPTLHDVTGDLTIASVLSGDSLTVSGNGIDTFDQADTYIGTTTLSAGVTIDDNVLDGAFGDGGLTIGAGASPVTIDDTGSGPAKLENDVTFQDGSTLAVDPTVVLSGSVTVNGSDQVQASGPDDNVTFDSSSVFAGNGTITMTGSGAVFLKSNLVSTVQMVVNSGELDISSTLLGGNNQIVVNGGTVKLLSGIGGSAGIDVKSGTLVTDATGIPSYTGAITVEAGGTIKDYDTQDSNGFGKGTLDLKGGILQNATGGAARIDNAVTLEGDVTVINQAPISAQQPLASLYLTSTITVDSAETLTANDPTAGEFIVLGALTGEGPLTITGAGSVLMVTSTATPLILTGTVRDYLAGALTADVTVNDANTVAELVAEDFTGGGNITPLNGAGNIDVQNGTLVSDQTVSNAPGIPGYTGAITVEAGGTIKDYDTQDSNGFGKGTLDLKGGILQNSTSATATIANPVQVTGSATSSSRGQKLKLSGNLNIAAGGSLDVVGTLALTGGITGSGLLTLDSDLFAVSGTNPGYTGTIKWNSGTVQVAPQNDPLGTGLMTSLAAQGVLQTEDSIDPVMDNPLLVQSGTLTLEGQYTFPNGITVDAGANLILSGAASQLVDTGTLSGGGNIIVAAGNFSDPGESSAFTGTVQIQGGDTSTFAATKLNILAGATETLNATVTSPTATPTGMISFFDGATPLGTAALSNGTASLTTATLAFGVHSVTFTYGGDANFSSFNSAPLNVFVGSSTNQVIVNTLYRQLLNRNAEETQSGLYYWSGLLDGGTSLSKVADGIATSVEYDQDIVTGIYQTYLKRAPDSGGLNAWVAQMQAGTINYETIRGDILGSQEFYNDMINQYGNYLTGLYQTLLGRNPDATGIAAWTPAGGAGVWVPPAPDSVRDVAAIGISTSFEQFENFVGLKFNQFLNRNPSDPTAASQPSAQYVTPGNPNGIPMPTDPASQGEQGFWADALNHGTTDGDFIADILSSSEYLHDQGLQ
jgi:hypothetical protein